MDKKKIFLYTIVLTATILLVSFCILCLVKNNTFINYNVMRLEVPDKDFKTSYYGKRLEEYFNTKKFTRIDLTGNSDADNKILSKFQLKIRAFVKSNDSIAGIHLKLNKNSKYEDFIKIIDLCLIEDARVYYFDNYDFWVTNQATKYYQKIHPIEPQKMLTPYKIE